MSLGKDETVKHYMYLNRMGRAKAVNSCGEELVALLCPPRTVDRKKRTKLNRCNLIYGLLREAPGMWAKYYNSAGISICSTSTDPPKKKKSSKLKKTSAAVPTRSLPRRKTRSNT
ncbi:expressed unknown protein [Seminavis robusta]|uniref:Uncharacterized protein n=1 Tax=Seminavis robusta TaxID=568900 RepID=A0A9N8HV92_9STRA|nr:expressed unknown protein [Seminavis robusta]|eukprot:Sro1949_g307320.1 n/a (115) ;mRNA; f:12097-12441